MKSYELQIKICCICRYKYDIYVYLFIMKISKDIKFYKIILFNY